MILDSRWIGEAVKDGHLVELTAWMRANIQIDDYVPAALSAYGPPAWPASKSESLRTRRPEARFPSC